MWHVYRRAQVRTGFLWGSLSATDHLQETGFYNRSGERLKRGTH
jgi:hypothetical protein